MKLEKRHIDFENYCKQIIGLQIVSVDYYKIAFDSNFKRGFSKKSKND